MEKEVALDFLKRLANGISIMFGENCEVVIHDMENFESSIVYIENGKVTQRKVGDKFKVLGTKNVDEFFKGSDLVNCKGILKNNHLIKSSTFHMKGNGYHYALGINYDYTNLSLVQSVLKDLTHVGENLDEAIERDSGDNILEELFEKALDHIGKPIALMSKEDRVDMIEFLDKKGAFSFHKSIPIVSEKMNVSRFTIYNYLKEIRDKEEKDCITIEE
ncbi:hypothetical protein CLPU_9c00600 [Gottschalkia purinilytica]|uniref:Transcriptional regulator n=1 Tax=Gottschalkia purinilytica TaxID=1503 RepID=A0A0L0W9E3_GOTPU|nr:helix-turn-helix transcriptional regulator [Gottschalkia purinilytica]KNF08164.1 hypothetical protein CLPU_9c00600 [Gottschalkia purinilytica]